MLRMMVSTLRVVWLLTLRTESIESILEAADSCLDGVTKSCGIEGPCGVYFSVQ